MLICTCPIDEKCPALGSQCDCFPWCEYLIEDGVQDDKQFLKWLKEKKGGAE